MPVYLPGEYQKNMGHSDTKKIIFNGPSALFFGRRPEDEIAVKVLHIKNEKEMAAFVKDFSDNHYPVNFVLEGMPSKQLFRLFKKHFKYVKAAGGIVKNTEGKYLFIKRFDIWDLPKGKLEKGEPPGEGALREVTEETGVTDLKIEKKLANTYHIYQRNGKTILKKTHWFQMAATGNHPLVPQTAEDITEAVWLDRKNSLAALSESYRSLHDILLPFLF